MCSSVTRAADAVSRQGDDEPSRAGGHRRVASFAPGDLDHLGSFEPHVVPREMSTPLMSTEKTPPAVATDARHRPSTARGAPADEVVEDLFSRRRRSRSSSEDLAHFFLFSIRP